MDTKNWRLQTRAVRGGQIRSSFDETSEALVLTSGYASQSVFNLPVGAELPALINKPFRMRELAVKLREILEAR